MLKTKGDRVKALRKALGLNQEQFAAKLKVTQAAISLIEKGDSLSTDLAELISTTYKCDLTWLVVGSGEMLQQGGIKKTGVPVYNIDFTAGDITQFQDAGEKITGYVDFDGFRACVGFVRVKGSSMYPDFVAGDYIGLEPEKDFKIIEYGQPYGIVTKYGQRMIKIIRLGKDDDNLILRSVNKDFDDIRIHKKDIDQLFKVHGPLRDQWQ